MTKSHGTKMKEWLSINDITLTCIAMKFFIEIWQQEGKNDMPNTKETSFGQHFDNLQDLSRRSQDMVLYENNTRTIITRVYPSLRPPLSLGYTLVWDPHY